MMPQSLTRNPPDEQLTPAWVPELVALLTDLHRRRASRFAFVGQFAKQRRGGRYSDAAA